MPLGTDRTSSSVSLHRPQGAEHPRHYSVDRLPFSTSSRFVDTRVHAWYTSVMAFPDHLVSSILDSFSPVTGSVFLDPYCGSGTALVEAQRKELRAFGVDANPSSVLASRVKTNWSINLDQVRTAIDSFVGHAETLEDQEKDPIVSYLANSGMIARGWIRYATAVRAAAVKRWIDKAVCVPDVHRFFMLALIATVVRDLSNVRFGPELYCVPASNTVPDVAKQFTSRLNTMAADLETSQMFKYMAQVRLGDSRDGRTLRTAATWGNAPAFVVTSPPYPTEHDYTRNARLELVFMESVTSLESLRGIKKKMLRSHSKGIYVNDRDANMIDDFEPVQRVKREIEARLVGKTSGFEGQYPKVVSNYFGGMLRHFRALSRYLPSGSKLAYVVGDEASYKGVYIPTAYLLADMIATYVDDLRVESVATWRSRRTHRDRQALCENVLLLERTGRGTFSGV